MTASDHPILPLVLDELCLRLRQLRARLCELFPCLIDGSLKRSRIDLECADLIAINRNASFLYRGHSDKRWSRQDGS